MKKVFVFLGFPLLALLLMSGCDGDTTAVESAAKDEVIVEEQGSNTEVQEAPRLNELSLGSTDLIPVFSPEVTGYTVREESLSFPVTLRAVSSERDMLISINNGERLPGPLAAEVTTLPADRSITVSVTCEDTGKARTYRITITGSLPGIANGTFEECDETGAPLSWEERNGNGEFMTETVPFALNDSRAAFFQSLTQSISGREVLSAPVELTEGKGITASVRCYLPADDIGGNTGRVNVSLKLYYYSNESCLEEDLTGYATMRKRSLNSEGSWEEIPFTKTAEDIPAGTQFVRMALRACYISEVGSAESFLYFDSAAINFQ